MDKLTPVRRSENMRRIKSKNTGPELIVRRIVAGMGFRYRLHRRDLPGKPDLVVSRLRKIIFVHGCFWHFHNAPGCLDGRLPKSRPEYWIPKLNGNRRRDSDAAKELRRAGWDVLIVWECESKDPDAVKKRLRAFFKRR